MLNKSNKRRCDEVLTKYGVERQLDKLNEESAELIQAVEKLKYEQTVQAEEHFFEELVDVIVVVEQMRQAFALTRKEINNRAKEKLKGALKDGHKRIAENAEA